MPIALTMFAGLLLLILLGVLKRFNSAVRKLFQMCFIVYWFVHIELAYQILSSFDCIDFLGVAVYHADLTRECFSNQDDENGDHLRFLLTYVLIFGIIWLIVVPVGQIMIFC